jgi:hypothetical protein
MHNYWGPNMKKYKIIGHSIFKYHAEAFEYPTTRVILGSMTIQAEDGDTIFLTSPRIDGIKLDKKKPSKFALACVCLNACIAATPLDRFAELLAIADIWIIFNPEGKPIGCEVTRKPSLVEFNTSTMISIEEALTIETH